jgi:hypothetical protein
MHIRSGIFWGILFIVLASLLLFQQLGWIEGNIWGYFGALAFMFFGLWLIGSYFSRNRPVEGERVSIPLEGAGSAHISIDHGAGKIHVCAGAPAGTLLTGTFANGLDVRSRREGDRLMVKMRNPPGFWTWSPGTSLDWEMQLNTDIPLRLDIDSGASASILDLSDLQVTELDLDTGASSVELTLPARAGLTRADIDAGVAAVKVTIPDGVAARIRTQGGLSAINVNQSRFPSQGGGIYQSPDYATAANRVELEIESGVGAVDIL